MYVLLTEQYVLACSKVTDNLFSVLLPAPLPIDRNVTHIRMSITTVRAADVLTFPPQKVNNKSDPCSIQRPNKCCWATAHNAPPVPCVLHSPILQRLFCSGPEQTETKMNFGRSFRDRLGRKGRAIENLLCSVCVMFTNCPRLTPLEEAFCPAARSFSKKVY